MMKMKRTARKTPKMKKTCRTWMRWMITMSHLMMGRLMRCFIVESACKNLICAMTANQNYWNYNGYWILNSSSHKVCLCLSLTGGHGGSWSRSRSMDDLREKYSKVIKCFDLGCRTLTLDSGEFSEWDLNEWDHASYKTLASLYFKPLLGVMTGFW